MYFMFFKKQSKEVIFDPRIKGLVAVFHSFCLFFIFYIQSSNHIHSIHSPRPLSIPLLLVSSVGQTSLWCRAENELVQAFQQADALLIEPRCTMLSHAAPWWATPHHTEPCHTIVSHPAPYWATSQLTEPRHTIQSHAAPYWATPHHTEPCHMITEPRCTILSHPAPYWAMPHPKRALRTEGSDTAQNRNFGDYFLNARLQCSQFLRNCWKITAVYWRARESVDQK